ncbi:hypothetical protein Daesc_006274 [Daldinia eschscholtzii]|uniref:Oligopeptide transporter n=1 Tax=Daldinia eschscholtzii TaxID=292717 RepID=A0AAX6MHV9_9PEZI
MSDHVSNIHGSAEITVEPNLQRRLVVAPNTDLSIVTDASLIAPFEEAEKRSQAPSAKNEHPSSITSCPATDDDGRIATEDEVRDLLNIVDRIPTRLWVACLAGILERFVWYGATAPLQNYLQNAPGGEVPGALGLGQASASNIVNALIIGSYITPVPAAVVADSWLGRYKTMLYAAIIESIGATILFATSLPPTIRGGAALGGVIPACILLAVGSGAFKTTVVPFIADQYDQIEPCILTRKTGEKVVTSRELTITYIYNAFYWAVNVVGFFADSTPLLEKYVGFWVAYLVPCCCMWLALIPILLGRNHFSELFQIADD